MKAGEFVVTTPQLFAATKDLTISVRVSKPVRFRVWLATKLIRVAAWLVGGSVQAEQD